MINLIKAQRDTEIVDSGGSGIVEGPIHAISQSEVSKTPEEEAKELEEYLANPDNRQQALQLAKQIQEVVGKNWFTLLRFQKKSGEQSPIIAFQKLKLCQMFGLLQQKIGDFRDGKKNMRLPMFKITIDRKDVVAAYHTIVQYHQDQIDHFTRLINAEIIKEAVDRKQAKQEVG